MKDSIRLLTEIGQTRGSWDIFDLLNVDSWGNRLRSLFQLVAVIQLLALGIVHIIKFLLSCTSGQMSFSQMCVQNKVLTTRCKYRVKAYPETELTTLEEHN